MKRNLMTLNRYLIEGKFLTLISKKIKQFFSKISKTISQTINKYLGIWARRIMCLITPVDPNKVFFMPQEGKYVCNPKYISMELQKRRPDLDIVWRYQGNNDLGMPETVRKVKLNSYEYFKEIFSSKIIVANSFLYVGMPYTLKKDQILIETWHGSLGIKRHDADAMKDKVRRKALIKTGKLTSYCITNSELENESLSGSYWPDTPMLEYGHARNDLFFDNHKEEQDAVREKVFEYFNLEPDVHIVMYAPTFRDNKSLEYYDIDFDRLLNTLEEKFGGTWYAFLRYHPSLVKNLKSMKNVPKFDNPRIINVTDYADMQELILVTDVAVTDYSSWIYDFVLLRRPGFIFATDIDSYYNERGFFYPLEETPFSISKNNDQLMDAIQSFDMETYLPKVEQFLLDKGCVEDGHAAERVVDLIEKELSSS